MNCYRNFDIGVCSRGILVVYHAFVMCPMSSVVARIVGDIFFFRDNLLLLLFVFVFPSVSVLTAIH